MAQVRANKLLKPVKLALKRRAGDCLAVVMAYYGSFVASLCSFSSIYLTIIVAIVYSGNPTLNLACESTIRTLGMHFGAPQQSTLAVLTRGTVQIVMWTALGPCCE